MQPLIQVQDLDFTYLDNTGKSIPALKEIQLNIQEGEWVALIGANGSGKSTLARHLNGLLLPTQGDVYVNGISTRQQSSWKQLRQNISMVFQHPESQTVATTVEEDVAFGPENLGVPSAEIRKRVSWSLDVVGLTGLQKRAPHHLSGGQKQRLALAGVLAMQPRCIILDEATSMLDPVGRLSFQEIIRDLHAQGVTIIQITQDMDEAALSDRVVVLSRGKIAREGTPRDVMTDGEFLQSAGLDLPPMTRFAQALKKFWPDFPGNLLWVNEVIEQLRQQSEIQPNQSRQIHAENLVSEHDSLDPDIESTIDEPNFIEGANLWHTYLRGTPLETDALRGIDFHLKPGEIVGVIGATGSGKSTLLQHLNGLLLPQAGTLRIGNVSIPSNTENLRTLRQQVALLFQQPEDQLFERYIADDVAYGPINLGLSLDEVRQKVSTAMEAVGLPIAEFRDRSIYSLSGGERRRAALAGVLALEPKVLVLDEATAGLDPRGRRDLIDLLRNWQAKGDRSIVWASHSMDEIAQMAKRIMVMAGGRAVTGGSPMQVFRASKNLSSYGLDVPQIVRLLNAVTQIGFMVDERIFTSEELAISIGSQIG